MKSAGHKKKSRDERKERFDERGKFRDERRRNMQESGVSLWNRLKIDYI